MLSQLLTLYTTPVVYLYLDRLATSLRRWRHAVDAARQPAAPCSARWRPTLAMGAGCISVTSR
jgi:hypothetical protein